MVSRYQRNSSRTFYNKYKDPNSCGVGFYSTEWVSFVPLRSSLKPFLPFFRNLRVPSTSPLTGRQKYHFFGLISRPARRRRENTASKFFSSSLTAFASIIISSKYTRQIFQINFDIFFISLSKLAVVLHKPKGMTLNCQSPIPTKK